MREEGEVGRDVGMHVPKATLLDNRAWGDITEEQPLHRYDGGQKRGQKSGDWLRTCLEQETVGRPDFDRFGDLADVGHGEVIADDLHPFTHLAAQLAPVFPVVLKSPNRDWGPCDGHKKREALRGAVGTGARAGTGRRHRYQDRTWSKGSSMVTMGYLAQRLA